MAVFGLTLGVMLGGRFLFAQESRVVEPFAVVELFTSEG